MALLFAPASVCLALLFDPSIFDPSKDTWLWAAVPLLALAYGACERFWGPLYEDLGKRAETDAIFPRAVEALALAAGAKDSVSSGHLKRVQRYCTEIAKALNCTEREIRTLEFGALLHDIGKIAVPENVLTKPGRLSPLEFSRVASHVQIGAEILSAVNFPLPVAELVLCHHENWDGTGYPRKLKGETDSAHGADSLGRRHFRRADFGPLLPPPRYRLSRRSSRSRPGGAKLLIQK